MTLLKKIGRARFALIGGVAFWAIAVISCTTTSRVAVVAPNIPGATFVGSEDCAMCHEAIAKKFAGSTHAKLKVEGENAKEIGCEACHGPGSVHVENGGGLFTMVNPDKSPETCFQCHLDKRGEFSLPSTHPVRSGDMSCSSCHDPHAGPAAPGMGAQLMTVADTCISCHQAQSGPFVFEHEASREGCTVCHSPHGSVNAKMLKARNASLCLQCHFQEIDPAYPSRIYIGGRDHASFLGRGAACWAGGCHEGVHGSHTSSSLRF